MNPQAPLLPGLTAYCRLRYWPACNETPQTLYILALWTASRRGSCEQQFTTQAAAASESCSADQTQCLSYSTCEWIWCGWHRAHR